jgi:hypothetical protein
VATPPAAVQIREYKQPYGKGTKERAKLTAPGIRGLIFKADPNKRPLNIEISRTAKRRMIAFILLFI